ncbi:hypothetical protein GCM10009678_14880 [Actinomadura kijaniata]|uniref:ABC-type Zn uptake system ZnuABC Zn-binding protein ZnuA n=1 Tax=Actinomadura namibiensis TaxID=182080 RepID=A0A7W3LQX0_ACTNM|nr:hypothetical protein [Actinomadura namibiensis]MBA8952653.1 ABC-type Zn uptake system ZnuABC Zn-binding protein ZnuA [Actinomadura namibiensis]
MPTADGWVALADGDAVRVNASYPDRTTDEAVAALRREGLRAVAVTTALEELPADPRSASALPRNEHGAVAVPVPWRFT